MNIQKAIEINKDTYHQYEKHFLADQRDAFKLNIEAMKRLEQNRTLHFIPSLKLLPGETD